MGGLGKILKGIPIIGGAFDNSDEQAMGMLQQNRDIMNAIKTPDLKWQNYDPEDAKYQTIGEDPNLRSMQMSQLAKMAGLADTGASAEDDLGQYNARQEGDQLARGGTQAAIQDAQNRGVSGGGMEFAMREIANQGGAQRAQAGAMQSAADAARQRALYNQAYGQGLGNQRSQDLGVNKANTDIINQFNMANTQQRNAAQQYNQQGVNQTKQQNFNNNVTKAGGQTQANTGMAQGYAAQNAANTAERNSNTQLLATAGVAAMGAPAAAAVPKPQTTTATFNPKYGSYA